MSLGGEAAASQLDGRSCEGGWWGLMPAPPSAEDKEPTGAEQTCGGAALPLLLEES